jgi:type II secretory pathway component PulM
MKDWFMSREPRERMILAVGAVAAVLIIGWRFVLLPLSTGIERLNTEVAAQSRLLVDAQNAAVITPADASRAQAEQSLYVVVDRTARSHGVAGSLTQTRQDGTTGRGVSFQAAPFDSMVAWLATLESEHGIGVESASFTASRAPGLVNGNLVLRR